MSCNKQELKFNLIKRIVDDGLKEGIVFVSITGGEPTLHPNFADIVKYIKSKGLYLHININGSIITNEIIVALKLVDGIGVSLDYFCDTLNFSGHKNSKKVIVNIRKLIKNKIKFNIVTVVTKENINLLDDFINFIISIGVKEIKLNYFLPIGSGKLNSQLYISYDDYLNMYNYLSKKHNNIEISPDSYIFYFRFANYGVSKTPINDISCGAYLRRIAVRGNGNVTGCLLLSASFDIGNVLVDNLSTLIRCRLPIAINDYRKDKFDTIYCDDCKYNTSCGRGCLAFFKSDGGVVDPRCPEVELYEYR